jgi:hypothetical protein
MVPRYALEIRAVSETETNKRHRVLLDGADEAD